MRPDQSMLLPHAARTARRMFLKLLINKQLNCAGGGLPVRIDFKQVIENARRSKLSKRRKRGPEVHHKYTGFETIWICIRSFRPIMVRR